MDLNISRLIYFLTLKRRSLALFSFRGTIISEKQLKPCILSGTIIISGGSTYSDLVF